MAVGYLFKQFLSLLFRLLHLTGGLWLGLLYYRVSRIIADSMVIDISIIYVIRVLDHSAYDHGLACLVERRLLYGRSRDFAGLVAQPTLNDLLQPKVRLLIILDND